MARRYLALAALAFLACAFAEDHYPDKYDFIDIDQILTNDRQREQYYKCFIGSAPCITPDAIFFKEYIPDAITTKCRRCTDSQKKMLDKVADWYSTNEPEKWDSMVQKMLEATMKKNSEKE